MRKVLLVVALGLGLAGCAQFQTAWSTLTGARVSPNAVYVAENSFDSVEIIATTYLRACHKAPSAWPAACTRSVESQVVGAVRGGREARGQLRAFMVAHPDAIGAQGLYDALKQATTTLQSIISTYNLTVVK